MKIPAHYLPLIPRLREAYPLESPYGTLSKALANLFLPVEVKHGRRGPQVRFRSPSKMYNQDLLDESVAQRKGHYLPHLMEEVRLVSRGYGTLVPHIKYLRQEALKYRKR